MIDLFGRKRIAELEQQNHLIERKASDLACEVIRHDQRADKAIRELAAAEKWSDELHADIGRLKAESWRKEIREKLAREHLGSSIEQATPEQAEAAWAFADAWIEERGRAKA